MAGIHFKPGQASEVLKNARRATGAGAGVLTAVCKGESSGFESHYFYCISNSRPTV